MRMNYGRGSGPKTDEQNPASTTAKSVGTVTPLLASGRAASPSDDATRPVRVLNARDQIDAAIDQWAESLVAIIEASDNPKASLLRAHRAIATKHKELESIARLELETRGQSSGVAHG